MQHTLINQVPWNHWASEAKPLSSGWCENRKFWVLAWVRGLASWYVRTSCVRRAYTNAVHTSSLERALNPANRRGHLTRSSFHRGLHKATSGEVYAGCALYPSSSWLAVTADSYVYIVTRHTLFAASTRTAQGR